MRSVCLGNAGSGGYAVPSGRTQQNRECGWFGGLLGTTARGVMKWCHEPAPGVLEWGVSAGGCSEEGMIDTRSMSLMEGGDDRFRLSVQATERLGCSITTMHATVDWLS